MVWKHLRIFWPSKYGHTGTMREKKEEKTDRRKGDKTILKIGQVSAQLEQPRTGSGGGSFLCYVHVLCGASTTSSCYGTDQTRLYVHKKNKLSFLSGER